MKTVTVCPACGSAAAEIVARLDDERRARFLHFSALKYGGLLDDWVDRIRPEVLRCNDCGHFWYRHQPNDRQLMAMYAAGRPLQTGAVPSREPTVAMAAEMQRFKRLVDDDGGGVSLLDYGSGFGRWARAAVQAGFDVTAFEPSAPRSAEDATPFELVHDLAQLCGRHFGAVQLEQVLEHIPDPLRTLQGLREFCGERTVVRITVPNMLRAPEGNRVWSDWPFDGRSPHILAPFEHLHGFTPRSLRRLARRAGFRPIAAHRSLAHYPALALRRVAGALYPRLDATCVVVQPTVPGCDC